MRQIPPVARNSDEQANAFSKKIENHACAVALHCMSYDFVRVHQTLKVTQQWPLALRLAFGK